MGEDPGLPPVQERFATTLTIGSKGQIAIPKGVGTCSVISRGSGAVTRRSRAGYRDSARCRVGWHHGKSSAQSSAVGGADARS